MQTSTRLLVLLTLALSSVAHADSTLIVSAELKSMWQGFEVFLDGSGVSNASNQAKRVEAVAPGRHELQVDLWTSPFKKSALCKGFIQVPRDSEVRIKCNGDGRIETIGASRKELPPVAQVAPRGDDPAGVLSTAARQMRYASWECRRLGDDVRDLRDDLDGRRRARHGRHFSRAAADLADAARDVCPRDIVGMLADVASMLGPDRDDEYRPTAGRYRRR